MCRVSTCMLRKFLAIVTRGRAAAYVAVAHHTRRSRLEARALRRDPCGEAPRTSSARRRQERVQLPLRHRAASHGRNAHEPLLQLRSAKSRTPPERREERRRSRRSSRPAAFARARPGRSGRRATRSRAGRERRGLPRRISTASCWPRPWTGRARPQRPRCSGRFCSD